MRLKWDALVECQHYRVAGLFSNSQQIAVLRKAHKTGRRVMAPLKGLVNTFPILAPRIRELCAFCL
jgi:hypothetical protein